MNGDEMKQPPAQPRQVLPIKLTSHQTNPANDLLEIVVIDEPGAGGAHHNYMVYWPTPGAGVSAARITFQNGPIKEAGVNGITQEALLAIVAHRLECFQAGPFKCAENANALRYVQSALDQLKVRTLARQQRGVEGTNQQ